MGWKYGLQCGKTQLLERWLKVRLGFKEAWCSKDLSAVGWEGHEVLRLLLVWVSERALAACRSQGNPSVRNK